MESLSFFDTAHDISTFTIFLDEALPGCEKAIILNNGGHFIKLLLFFFFSVLGPHLQHMEVPRLWVKLELQLLGLRHSHSNAGSKPVSATYTTAHSNARLFTL